MISLSNATKNIKNSLFDSGSWLVLLTLTNKDETITIRICSNTEDVLFGSNTFTSFPFQLEEVTESNKGELPTVNLVLSNVERIVQAYIEQDADLGSGWTVHIDIVHNTAIDSGVSEISYDFVTMNATADVNYVTFSCGIRNPLRQQFPRLKMLPNSCQNTFKKGGCTYSGNDETCMKTLSDCRAKFYGQSKIPYLGFAGIPTTGIYQ